MLTPLRIFKTYERWYGIARYRTTDLQLVRKIANGNKGLPDPVYNV